MATVADLIVKIGGDSSGLQKELAATQRQIKRSLGAEAIGVSNTAKNMLVGLAAAMGLVGAASIKMSSDFAASKTAFTQLLGSADKAQKMMDDLTQFAAETPFELKGLTESAKKLLAFQFAAQDIIPIMSAVGDAVALVGGGQEAIDGVVRALGQIQAKGKLSAEEMNQLAERGINGWQYIADAMGISIAEVMDLCQKGAIDSTTAINAVVAGMQTNFVGGMDAMSRTVPGLLSTIKDNASMVLKEIGDSLTDALDLKGVLTNVANWLTTFASVVKSNGLKEAIQGLIPPEVVAGIFVFGGALVGTAVAALVLFKTAIIAALAPLAPFIAAGAAVGAIAYEIWNNWEPLSELFSTLWETITQYFSDAWGIIADIIDSSIGWALGYIGAGWNAVGETTSNVWGGIVDWIDNAWTSIKQVVADGIAWIVNKMQPLLDMVKNAMPESVKNLFSNLASGVEKMASAADKLHWGGIDVSEATSQEKPAVNKTFTGLHNTNANTSAVAGAGSSKSADQAAKEISAINKQISELQQKAPDFAKEWGDAQLRIAKAAADGGAAVLANIYVEGESRKKSMDDLLDKFTDSVTEAQQIYDRAVQSGDAEAIASAKAMLEERKNAEIAAAQAAADAKKEIDRQTTDDLMANATQLQTFKAEIDEAMKQGDYERFMQSMTDENVAFAAQMAEKQSVMQQYYDWRMEAEQSFMSFQLQAAEQLKTSLGQAAAQALVYGKSFKTALKDMGKQIVAMYIQWEVEKIAAAALSKTLMKQETATVAAQGAAMAASLAPAAWAKLVLSPGSAALATGLLTAGMTAAAGIGASIGGLAGAAGAGAGGVPQMASGGIVTGPTLAMIGEGRDNEAVIPLRRGILSELLGDGGSQVLATQNIYGDINTGADSDEMYADFSSMVINGMRGR
ncbi:MAG: tape measure protein [Acidaminococcaceae bacterium]